MIDRLMSRIRIQTKVLILVTPFVLSITAVGLTGLYTSGLLQGRMEISNTVMQALSGFKQVYSAMSRFLLQPSAETHGAARAQLETQIADLKTMAEGLRGETDVALLDQAVTQSGTVFANIDTLWTLQQQQDGIVVDVGARTEELLAVQAAIGKQAFVLLAAAKNVEKAAKAGLKTALQMGAQADETMRKAVGDLAAAEGEIAKADRVGNKLRAIVGNANQIRVVFAELAARPDEASVKKVEQALYAYGKELDGLAVAIPGDTVLAALPEKAKPALKALETDARTLVDLRNRQRSEFDVASGEIDGMWSLLSQFAESQKESAGTERQQANSVSVAATVAGILVAMLAGGVLVITLKGPIGQITATMRRLADGALDTAVVGEARPDEIGDMARALSVFKTSALAKVTMEEEAAINRREAEGERQRNDAARQRQAEDTRFAVETLAAALARLSAGDLSFVIETPFAADLDRLRHDFNGSVAGLRDTLGEVRVISGAIHENGRQMSDAVGDLAQRTEKQAASLEETSAALDDVSSTVAAAAGRAGEVQRIVQQARSRAETSSGTVQNAVLAMQRIQEASQKIGQIVGVIDTIAFQTNLLALNAGVEAARAGEAGKGFAVVAQEVRELAQRSTKAAKEIGELIQHSSNEVNAGSRYVEDTGSVLTEIAGQIIGIADHIDRIATTSSEQSGSLRSINGSVNEIDRMTQQNAAMVEETNAATLQLSDDIAALAGLLARFSLPGDEAQTTRRRAA